MNHEPASRNTDHLLKFNSQKNKQILASPKQGYTAV